MDRFDDGNFAEIVSRKYGVMTAMLLCFVAEQQKTDWNIDQIFSAWRRRKPSRSTFTQILTEMQDVGWVNKYPGAKKSEIFLQIHAEQMRQDIGLKDDFGRKPETCWTFTGGYFDRQLFLDDA